MKYIVTINDKNYEVEVERGQATLIKTSQAAAPSPQPVAAPVAATPAAPPAQPQPTRLLPLPMYRERLLKLLCPGPYWILKLLRVHLSKKAISSLFWKP
jgi:hypothetical protein